MNNKLEIPSKLNDVKNIIESSITSYIKIQTFEKNEFTITESKIGGIPYWPESLPLPKIGEVNAKLIVQINFEELFKQNIYLENYPTSGILQFYAPENDHLLGLVFDEPGVYNKSNIKVIYHADTSIPSLNSIELFEISNNNENMPFAAPLGLKFSLDEEYLCLADQYSVNRIYKDINFHDNPSASDFFYEEINNEGSKIGGYAYFTQEDPRDTKYFDDDWLLLLQIDSDNHLMIGDCGVANWFIKKEDLLNKDFSNIFFNWDCC